MNQERRLVRSSRNKMLFGVIGGFAEYFNMDATLLRILFLITFFLPGPSLILYIIAAIIMPLDTD